MENYILLLIAFYLSLQVAVVISYSKEVFTADDIDEFYNLFLGLRALWLKQLDWFGRIIAVIIGILVLPASILLIIFYEFTKIIS